MCRTILFTWSVTKLLKALSGLSRPCCRTAALPAPAAARLFPRRISLRSCRSKHVCNGRWYEGLLLQHSAVAGPLFGCPPSRTSGKGEKAETRVRPICCKQLTLVTKSNRVVQGVAPFPHRLWLLITDVTAKLTFDRCVCVCVSL